MVELYVERTITASPQAVFDWLVDPVNLTAAPLALRAGFAKGTSAAAAGARRWVVGAGMWFEEEITAYDPPLGSLLPHPSLTAAVQPRRRHAHAHFDRRWHTRWLANRVQPSLIRRRQSPGGSEHSAASLELLGGPLRMRESAGTLAKTARVRTGFFPIRAGRACDRGRRRSRSGCRSTDHAVARDDDADRVAAVGQPHRARGAGRSDLSAISP